MIPGLNKPLRHCSLSDLTRHSENLSVRQSQAQRIYSLGLLDEALKLGKKVGLPKAALESGVNINSLRHYSQVKKIENGHKTKPYKGSNRIDPDLKRACLNVYRQLHASEFGGHRKCWIEAGKRVGINGRSVEFQYVRGIWKP